MKNTIKVFGIIAIVAVIGFTMIACNKSGSSSGSNSSKSSGGGGKSINSAEDLKEYLDSQPANSPNNPIKVSMGANELMLPKIKEVLNSAGKYVSLNLTGNALSTISDFTGCKTLVSINIPNNVTSIGQSAFLNCTSLTSITIPDSVTSIGREAFVNCTSLTSITIPNSVTSIGQGTFVNCTSLTSITIPNSVTSIGIEAFGRCTSLSSVTIPNSVTSIGGWAFGNCTSLSSVTFQGTISSNNFDDNRVFEGDLREKYLAGGIGTYTTTAPVNNNSKWTKQ
jgi:hypothetical protein